MANAKVIQAKQEAVEAITAKLRESASTVVADYRGLNVAQVTELRKQLREAGIEFQVLKNSLLRRATAAAELTELDEVLTGPTAIAFSGEDAVAPAKILNDFAKKNDALKLKGGVVEGRVVGVTKSKRWQNCHPAKVSFPCSSACFKLLCATSRLQLKPLQRKKNKARKHLFLDAVLKDKHKNFNYKMEV
ncbi:50S ribosomal protein L10 [Paenibacillus sp. P1XP2]|nr:50S ribosomal protein L10 [Paenibacillus sp. P1XP2]